MNDELKLTCNCGKEDNCKPIFGVSADWKGFDNGNDYYSKSKFKTKTTENGNGDGEGRDDESGNRREGKATKAQLIIPVVKPHLNKLFTR